jgi:HPt (histidine-containing phosphotransfer) domain-containing protein
MGGRSGVEKGKHAQRRHTAGPAGLDDEMARELLAHYLDGAGERLSSFAQALAESEARPDDLQALDRLRRALHKIAGSAGTYGFPDLTRSARRLEQDVLAARAAPPGAAALFAAGRGFQQEMSEAFARAARDLPTREPIGAPTQVDTRRNSAQGARASAPAVPAPAGGVRAADQAMRERLVVAVICEGAGGDADAEAVGAGLAGAGTHLIGAGPEHAARGYRRAGGEGLVLWIVPGSRSSAGAWVDLPLCAATLPAQCALVAAAADGAILIGGGGETLAHCGFLLREGKPVVALLGSGGAASVLSGRELGGALVVAATSAEDAVFEILARLSAHAIAR